MSEIRYPVDEGHPPNGQFLFRAHERYAIETRLDDGSLVRLTWTQQGSLSIQHFIIANLKDGHGFLLTASGQIGGDSARQFAEGCLGTERG